MNNALKKYVYIYIHTHTHTRAHTQICDTYLLCVQRDFLLQLLTPQQILQGLEQHPGRKKKKKVCYLKFK